MAIEVQHHSFSPCIYLYILELYKQFSQWYTDRPSMSLGIIFFGLDWYEIFWIGNYERDYSFRWLSSLYKIQVVLVIFICWLDQQHFKTITIASLIWSIFCSSFFLLCKIFNHSQYSLGFLTVKISVVDSKISSNLSISNVWQITT